MADCLVLIWFDDEFGECHRFEEEGGRLAYITIACGLGVLDAKHALGTKVISGLSFPTVRLTCSAAPRSSASVQALHYVGAPWIGTSSKAGLQRAVTHHNDLMLGVNASIAGSGTITIGEDRCPAGSVIPRCT